MENEKREISFEDILKIKKGTKNRETYDYPFMKGYPIDIRLLTQQEVLDAQVFGHQKSQTLELTDGNMTMLASYAYTNMELLRKACYIAGTDKRFFQTIEEVGNLQPDESEMLFEYYKAVQERYAPIEKLQTEEDFKELIEEIKKKGVGGISLSFYTIERLLHTLIAKPEILLNLNGSSSMQGNKLNERMKKELLKTQEPVVIKKDEIKQ